jgi:haloacetate dehalogenase
MRPPTDTAPITIPTSDGDVRATVSGDGPPVLLLHGFPETHLMWRDIAPHLARRYRVICADLPGYGDSACPRVAADHEPGSKRAMARTLVAAMRHIGFARFAVIGHDRGGRVAYRLALDHPDAVSAVAVLDVVPTAAAWDHADANFALGYWPWLLLAQPAPLPERVLVELADVVVDSALGEWGTPVAAFPRSVRDAYVAALRSPEHAQAICEEYRAAAGVDRQLDASDVAAGRRIRAPLLALWSKAGPLSTWYASLGGPLGVWRSWAEQVSGEAVPGGHFFPEEHADHTAALIERFLSGRCEWTEGSAPSASRRPV